MRKKGTVAVVMEGGSVRQLLAGALALGGYEVQVAGSGSGLLGPPQRGRPDLILLDVSLPATDSAEALRRIRAEDRRARVVAFSARPTVEMARQARNLGAREFVGDPFDLKTLLHVIADNARP